MPEKAQKAGQEHGLSDMTGEAEVKSFGVLAILALLFAAIAVGSVLYFQGEAGKAVPKCGGCQYLSQGACFDYECCDDSECESSQMCVSHSCYDLDCASDEIAKDHGCVAAVGEQGTNGTENATVGGCSSNEDCPSEEICENATCVPLYCGKNKRPFEHECAELECTLSEDCKKDEFCLEFACKKLECKDCQFVENHTCIDYECCDYSHCGEGQVCVEHECVNKTCPEGQHLFAGRCIKYACTNDTDCDDKNTNTIDFCIDPGTSYSKCDHSWVTINFTGNKTLTLHINQSAYYSDKQSRITLLELRDENGYFWNERARLEYSLWGRYNTSWVLIAPSDANATVAAAEYWKNTTINDDRLSVIMKKVDKAQLTATIQMKYTKV